MLGPRNAINLQSKGSRRGKKRSKKQRKKCRGRESVSSAALVCVWGWGDGVNWYRIKLGGPGPAHTPFCVQINVTPTPLWSPLPLLPPPPHPPTPTLSPLLFAAAQCACVNSHVQSNMDQSALHPISRETEKPVQGKKTSSRRSKKTSKIHRFWLKHFIRTHCTKKKKNEMSLTPSGTNSALWLVRQWIHSHLCSAAA